MHSILTALFCVIYLYLPMVKTFLFTYIPGPPSKIFPEKKPDSWNIIFIPPTKPLPDQLASGRFCSSTDSFIYWRHFYNFEPFKFLTHRDKFHQARSYVIVQNIIVRKYAISAQNFKHMVNLASWGEVTMHRESAL